MAGSGNALPIIGKGEILEIPSSLKNPKGKTMRLVKRWPMHCRWQGQPEHANKLDPRFPGIQRSFKTMVEADSLRRT
jgi:hypothetical protein